MLCATIKEPTPKAIRKANRFADLIELRLDSMANLDFEQLVKLRNACNRPVIFKGDLSHLPFLGCLPDYFDLPVETPIEVFEEIKEKFPSVKRICSWHDFEKTPKDFSELYSRPAELYKMAAFANSTLDAMRMLLFLKSAPKPTLGISMGEKGIITRILAPIFGAPFTYAPIDDEQRTAPGQILLSELEKIYYFRKLNPSTCLYGLIGDPVSKSASHLTHNYAFEKLGLNAVYVKMQITEEELPDFFPLAKKLGFNGLSVTMPLKEKILPYLNKCQESCQAINTLVVRNDEISGWNTDGPGALHALEKRESIVGKKIVLLGAGGAAKGIAKEAIQKGGVVTILNRTLARAQELADQFKCSFASLDSFPEVAKRGYDILINCTSVGMGDDPQMPVDPKDLLEGKIVMECVSNPRETNLLKAAKAKKCIVIEGMEMFIQQAVGQYCLWFKDEMFKDEISTH